jgi:hypothetical protein
MAESLPQVRSYTVHLGHPSGPRFHPFKSISFVANSDAEAKEKANEWAMKNGHEIDARTWLRVVLEENEIYRRQLGK